MNNVRRLVVVGVGLAALVVATVPATAQQPASGLLIGVNVTPTTQGLYVQSVIPGTPAQGQLQPGDILRFLTAPGHAIYSAQRINHIEQAKSKIGLNQPAYLEVLRNQQRHFFGISFVPAGNGGTVTTIQAVQQPVKARQMFDDPGGKAAPAVPPSNPRPRPGFDPFK